MRQGFVICLREGLEAFLIVAISLAYLRQTGREHLTAAVRWGVAVALVISALGGYLLYNATNQEWLDGPLALVAAVSVTWMVIHMWRVGRGMKREIEGRIESSLRGAGGRAFLAIFLFTLLMVTREGMETALLLIQLKTTNHLLAVATSLFGAACALVLAWLYSRYGRRIPLSLFFQVTAIFLLVFVVQLVIQGVHQMSEQHFLGPYSTVVNDATESWGPDSPFGHLLTYLLAILPLGWLLIVSIVSKRSIFQKTVDSAAH